jgi:hypothetical protein
VDYSRCFLEHATPTIIGRGTEGFRVLRKLGFTPDVPVARTERPEPEGVVRDARTGNVAETVTEIDPRERASERVLDILTQLTNEMLPEQNAIPKSRERYRAKLMAGSAPIFHLEHGGVVRMAYFNGRLEHVDESKRLRAPRYDGTLEEHWQAIRHRYEPRLAQCMAELGIT